MQITKHILKKLKLQLNDLKYVIEQNELALKKSKSAYNKLEKEYQDLEEFTGVVNTKDYINYLSKKITTL
jgi:hypothetical protein